MTNQTSSSDLASVAKRESTGHRRRRGVVAGTPRWAVVAAYVLMLSVLSLGASALTLVYRWGEVVPFWVRFAAPPGTDRGADAVLVVGPLAWLW